MSTYIDDKQCTFLDSTEVTVFPFSKDRPHDPSARMLSEKNFVNIVNSTTDHDCYVIGRDAKNIYFVMNGYRFGVKYDSIRNIKPCFAHVAIQNSLLDGGDTIEGQDTQTDHNLYIYSKIAGEDALADGQVTDELGAGSNLIFLNRYNTNVTSELQTKNSENIIYEFTYELTKASQESDRIFIKEVNPISVEYCKSGEDTWYDLYREDPSLHIYSFYNTAGDSAIKGDYPLSSGDTVRIKIQLDAGQLRSSFIINIIHDMIFTGVWFTQKADVPGVSESYSLQLLDGDGKIPEASYHKFDAKSLNVHKIVCGNAISLLKSRHDIADTTTDLDEYPSRNITFNFLIAGTPVALTAEEDMTWQEWLDSSYNVSPVDLNITDFPILLEVEGNPASPVQLNNLIIEGSTYKRSPT